jgi:pimeloyl-ACP methyl ester carboxylesterase
MTSIYRSAAARDAVEQRYRCVLDAWPCPVTETMLPTRHGHTFVATSGPPDAPPLVLLHGGGFNSASWVRDVRRWARTRRVHAVDLLGEPGFSAATRPPYDSAASADRCEDVLDGLGITTTAVVGVSLGGWVALDHALRRPGRTERLVLLAPGGIGRQRYGALLASLALLPFGRRGRRAGLRLVLGPTPAGPDADDPVTRALDDFLLLVQESYRPRRDPLPVFTDDQLRSLDVPLLVVVGEKDRMLDARGTARRVRELVPAASVSVLPGTGHVPVGNAPTVDAFLAGDERWPDASGRDS